MRNHSNSKVVVVVGFFSSSFCILFSFLVILLKWAKCKKMNVKLVILLHFISVEVTLECQVEPHVSETIV